MVSISRRPPRFDAPVKVVLMSPKADALANLETALACVVAARASGFSEALELLIGYSATALEKVVAGARLEMRDA
jgi:hypothetical protein